MQRLLATPAGAAQSSRRDAVEDGHSPTSFVRRLFWVPSSAINLAVLRIIVFGTLAVLTYQARPVAFSRMPDSLVAPPALLGSTIAALPRSAPVLAVVESLALATAVAAALGWRTKITAPVATVLAVYILGVPQLVGKVDHYHHLVWLAALLALAPCADALAIDSIGTRPPDRSVKYGFPLRVAWLLIGLCYFFPGLAKLSEWDVWLSADNMRGLLRLQQWAAGGGAAVPTWLLVPAALGTLVFELGFVFAVFNRVTRPWALAVGLAFHFATFATMGILFWSLWICYPAFIDWSRLGRGSRETRIEAPTKASKIAALVLVIGVGLTGISLLGSAWPFAAYPTFTGDFSGSTRARTTEVLAVTRGVPRPVEILDWLPASRRAAVTWNALDHPDALVTLARAAAPRADSIQVWQVDESTLPGNRGRVLDRQLLLEAELHH